MKMKKNMSARVLYSLILVLIASSLSAASADTVTGILVHGNYRTPETEIISLSGLSVGSEVSDADLAAARERLVRSGKFDEVSIEKRYRTLDASGPVFLLIRVKEGEPLPDRFLYSPIVSYSDEDGFTAGVTIAAIDLFGWGERLVMPVSFFGVEQVGATLRFEDVGGVIGMLDFSIQRRKWTNPHYDIEDDRISAGVQAIQRYGWFRMSGGWLYEDVTFGALEEKLHHANFQFALDTRQSRYDSYDAVYASAGIERSWSDLLDDSFDRYNFDLRAYKQVFGRTVLAGWVRSEHASDPLPAFMRPVIGGARTLRGHETDAYSGDNLFLATVELRVPLTPVAALYKGGIFGFYDWGAVWDDGTAFDDAVMHEGVGIGAWFIVSGIGANLSVANNRDGEWRVHFGSGLKF